MADSLRIMSSNGITAFGEGNWFNLTFMDAWVARKAGKYHEWLAVFNPWYADPYNRVTVTPLVSSHAAPQRALLTAP